MYLPAIIENAGIPQSNIVIVHTKQNEPIEGVHNLWDLDEINIHRWWNRGIEYALARGARYVAVLNDDVELADDPLNKITDAMREKGSALGYPYPFSNTVCGYCWVVDLASDVRPDERFRWWYGDNDLNFQARAYGEVLAVPAKVRHLHGNELTKNNEELMALTVKDEDLFFEKWQDVFKKD